MDTDDNSEKINRLIWRYNYAKSCHAEAERKANPNLELAFRIQMEAFADAISIMTSKEFPAADGGAA